jgi:hypothetical protein
MDSLSVIRILNITDIWRPAPATDCRAISMAVTLGLMVVLPRRRWVKGRYLRTSNRYLIGVPDLAVTPGQRPPARRRSTGQNGHRPVVSKQAALEEMLQQAAGQPDLLALRRAAMLQRQRAAHNQLM